LEPHKSVTLIDLDSGKAAKQRSIELNSGRKVHRKTFLSVVDAITWLEANPKSLVELTIQSDTYLTAEERKSIYSAHDGIVEIIPIVLNVETADSPSIDAASLSKSVEELFRDYFKHQKGQEPNDQILSLLREVLKVEEA
jgi:exonuclease SbcD